MRMSCPQTRPYPLVLPDVAGRCQFPHPVSRKAIYIHHFGMLQKLSNEPCNLFEQWGASCDPEMHAALGHNDQNLQWGCHIPHQDIVVPPSPYEVPHIS